MFVKIYPSLWDGTLAERWEVWSLFVFMLANCDAEGVLDMTPAAIARRSCIPVEKVEEALAVLEAPDPGSRTADAEGRRVMRLDAHREWGWRIVNYKRYRNMRDETVRREQNRVAQAKWRGSKPESKQTVSHSKQPSARVSSSKQASAAVISGEHPSASVSRGKPPSAQEEVEVDLEVEEVDLEEAEESKTESKSISATSDADASRSIELSLVPSGPLTPSLLGKKNGRLVVPDYPQSFERFWSAYRCERRTRKPQTFAQWKKQRCEEVTESVLAGLERYKTSAQWSTGYMPEPERWLKGRCWEDALELPRSDNDW